ncbi:MULTISPECIES: DUF2568 domain-containing protein [unclassified Blastococcus]
MVETWQWTWALAAFAAELAALVVLSRWGLAAGPAGAGRVLLAVALPLAAAVLWGLFAAPRSVVDVPLLAVLTKVVVFGAAVAALWASGSPRLAAVLGVVAVLSAVLSGPVVPEPAPVVAVSSPAR